MALYRADRGSQGERTLLWRVEADLRGKELGKDFVFVQGSNGAGTLTQSRFEITRLLVDPNPIDRHIVNDWSVRLAEADTQRRNLFSGPLAHMSGIERKSCGKLAIALGKTDYAAHHATTPLQGKHTAWTKKHNPQYGVEIVDENLALAVFEDPQNLSTAFAAAILVESNDGKLVYGIRNPTVDCYQNTWSLPSGGRLSGNPHEVVDDLICHSHSLDRHLKQMLSLEYSGLAAVPERVEDIKPLGIFRANDYDVTFAALATIDACAEELQRSFASTKYTGSGSVSADTNGMNVLLQNVATFPAPIQGVIALAASEYGIDIEARTNDREVNITRYA